MKIVFLGTPEFAVASLRAIADAGFDVAAVVTAPDRPAGRGRKIRFSAVKEYALERGFRILQPVNLKDREFVSELRSVNADLQIVVAFRMLPEIVWNMPPLGTYNLHASLLPAYRGAAPINRAIMNGEKETGVTTFKLKHEVDTGNILLQESVSIGPDTTAGELHDRLMMTGAQLLVKSVKLIGECSAQNRDPEFILQDENKASHAPKLFREDCELDFSRDAQTVHNKVRGLSPVPGAFTFLHRNGSSEQVKIFRTRLSGQPVSGANGSLLVNNENFLGVNCGDLVLEIMELQAEGKKRISAGEFLRGYRLSENPGFFGPAAGK